MGDNDTRYQPESGRWTPGCNQKDPQDICERRQASRPPVVSPFPEEKQGWFRGHDTHFYLDVETTAGGDVDTPWQWNAGVRYSF